MALQSHNASASLRAACQRNLRCYWFKIGCLLIKVLKKENFGSVNSEMSNHPPPGVHSRSCVSTHACPGASMTSNRCSLETIRGPRGGCRAPSAVRGEEALQSGHSSHRRGILIYFIYPGSLWWTSNSLASLGRSVTSVGLDSTLVAELRAPQVLIGSW